jgi:hypothetical protein
MRESCARPEIARERTRMRHAQPKEAFVVSRRLVS